jgi:hypothetical protein
VFAGGYRGKIWRFAKVPEVLDQLSWQFRSLQDFRAVVQKNHHEYFKSIFGNKFFQKQ